MAARRRSIVLTLIRCGETTWDAQGRLHGRSDLPLSIDGRAAVAGDVAALTGKRLWAVYHPPDDAAVETGQIVARAAGAKAKAVSELAEADLGVLDGMSVEAFAERFPKRYKQWQSDPLSLSPPEGEGLIDARARLFANAARLLRRCRGEEMGLVLHPLGLGLMRCWLAERSPTELWSMVRDRPRIERYLLAADMVQTMGEAARAESLHS